RIDGLGGAHQLPGKYLSWKLREHDVGTGLTRLNSTRVFLRHVHVDTEYVCLHHVEKVCSWNSAAAGINEVTDIGIAGYDYAVKRSINFCERDERLIVTDVSHVRVNDGFIRTVGADGVVHILLRDSVLAQQPLISLHCDLREFEVRLYCCQRAARLCQLLIDFRTLYRSQ